MTQLVRYGRAFLKALELTLRGEAIEPPPTPYPHIQSWVDDGLQLVEAAFRVCEQHGLDEAQRQQITLHLDRRDISMQTILAAVQHNMLREYPLLLRTPIEHNLTALHALNLNDQYRVGQLAALESLPPAVRSAVQSLAAHIQHVPTSETKDEPT